MKIIDHEKSLLGKLLSNVSDDIKFRIISELLADRLSTKEHTIIYKAISKCVRNKERVDSAGVSIELGKDLDKVGGMEYLISLAKFDELYGTESYEKQMRLIDNAGRLRYLAQLFGRYKKDFEDIDSLVSRVSDIDEFLSNFMEKANKGISSVRSNYKHISEAVDEARQKIVLAQEGQIIDIISCGMPSLEPFFIPRPSSFGVICGIESMGKTQLGIEIGLGVAQNLKENKLPGEIALNVLETPGYRIALRLACLKAQVSSTDLMGGTLSKEQTISVNEHLDYIQKLPIVYNDDPNITSDEYVWHAIAHNLTKGRVYAVADYLELFKDKRDQTEEQRVTNIARNIKTVCNICGSCEVAISQFNKSVFSNSYKIGGTHAARQSGAVAQAAEWWIEIWNPIQMERRNIQFSVPDGKRDDLAYGLILKNKEYDVGEVEFEWIPEYMTFRDTMLPDGKLFKSTKADQF